MKRGILGGLLIFFASSQAIAITPLDTLTLKPKPIYGKEARITTFLLDNNHYRQIHFNDSLSSVVLDEYVKTLDNNKTYFLQSDIKSFEGNRYKIDDLTKAENVDVAYQIYGVFQKRFKERMNYIQQTLIPNDFEFVTDEYYETNRDKEPWANSVEELNDVWRKIIKSQALSLKLAGKEPKEIKETLKSRYDRMKKSMDQFNAEDVFSIYMNTITEAYDPHTSYFSPKAADLFDQSMKLSLEGIGARLQTENDYTKVVEILPGGPAEKSDKIHANDKIIGVAQGDEEMVDVVGWRVDEVVKLIKGPKGTKVRLLFYPAAVGVTGATTEISLIRDKIKLEDQQAKKSIINYKKDGKDLKLGVIMLPSFYMDFEAYQKGDPDYTSTTRDVQRLIQELKKENVNGIVLDLRNNGGGSLAEAIQLTGLFIKEGPVVQVKNSTSKIEVLSDDDPGVVYNGQLVVLTNRFSASASEIFAGAIQDYHRGVVVGESTHGKGTVQTVVDLSRFISDSGADVGKLKLTFQKFYRVTGSSTQQKGVTPDVLLPTPYDHDQYGEGSYPNAMPWDEIRGTYYQRTPIITDKVITGLNKSYNERLKTDPTLTRFVEDTEEFKKNLSETRVSLNEETRKKEMAIAEKRKESSTLNTTIRTKDGAVINDMSELDDEYLREGLLVLSEMILNKIG